MKAIVMKEAGNPEVLLMQEIPEPEITDGHEIKIKLKAAGVNPIDTKLRQRGVFFENALPCVLGCDGAGVIEDIGSAVTLFKPGDEVWFCHGGLGREQGNYAEYTVIHEDLVQAKPKRLSFEEAAAFPLVLLTAWEGLYHRAKLHAGQSVLIHAGAGGVGHVAIQLAKFRDAKVITTVSGDDKASFVTDLGADKYINYKKSDFVEEVLKFTNYEGVNVALDTVGPSTFKKTIEAMALYGSLITLLDPGTDINWKTARNKNLRIGFELMLTPLMLEKITPARIQQVNILRYASELIETGKLRVHISQVLPLRDAGQAHRLIEAGHNSGKIVLSME